MAEESPFWDEKPITNVSCVGDDLGCFDVSVLLWVVLVRCSECATVAPGVFCFPFEPQKMMGELPAF